MSAAVLYTVPATQVLIFFSPTFTPHSGSYVPITFLHLVSLLPIMLFAGMKILKLFVIKLQIFFYLLQQIKSGNSL